MFGTVFCVMFCWWKENVSDQQNSQRQRANGTMSYSVTPLQIGVGQRETGVDTLESVERGRFGDVCKGKCWDPWLQN